MERSWAGCSGRCWFRRTYQNGITLSTKSGDSWSLESCSVYILEGIRPVARFIFAERTVKTVLRGKCIDGTMPLPRQGFRAGEQI